MSPMLVLLPMIAAAPVPKDFKPAKSDAEKILGTWEIVESFHSKIPNPGGIGIIYEFHKDGTCVILHQDKSRHPLKYSLNSKGTPKSYSWDCPWGSWTGAYVLEKDELKMAAVSGQNVAPPRTVEPGDQVQYTRLRRVK